LPIDDPKSRLKDTPAESLSITDLIAALKAFRGDDDETLKKRAQFEAEAQKRVLRPENERHPGISAFSYPEGELKRPKPELRCKVFWVGIDERVEQNTPAEVELFNQLIAKTEREGFSSMDDDKEPCAVYSLLKTDGSPLRVTVKGRSGMGGRLTEMVVAFPCRGDNRHNLPTKVAMLRDMLGIRTEEGDLRRQIAELQAQLVATGR
jgi:hypothetical protein